MRYYLYKDFGSDGYSLEEYDSLEEASREITREMEENYMSVKQYRIFESRGVEWLFINLVSTTNGITTAITHLLSDISQLKKKQRFALKKN